MRAPAQLCLTGNELCGNSRYLTNGCGGTGCRAGLPYPLHLRADELTKRSPTQYQAVRAEVFASQLPSDPGLKVVVAEATLEEKKIPRRSIFGRQYINRAPHIVFEPALMIFFTVLALNMLGDVVRSRFDVREGAL